jgi:ribosomal protein S18 acetylase RimI-like enzyme
LIEAVRPASASDLERLSELSAIAVAEQAGARGGAIWSAREARPDPAGPSFAAVLGTPDHAVLCGTLDDVLVGYAVVGVEELRSGERLGVLDDIYVEPEAREVGLGEMLVEQAVAWCRERQCVGVDSLVRPGNRSSKNFFEMLGFTARAIVVHRSLR